MKAVKTLREYANGPEEDFHVYCARLRLEEWEATMQKNNEPKLDIRDTESTQEPALSHNCVKMTKIEFIQAIRSAGLSHYEKELDRLCQHSIAICCDTDSDNPEIGESKLGGLPDMPSDIAWPKYKCEPLSFIAQFNMSDVTEYDIDNILPATGIMYFFYDANQDAWGFDPADAGRWKVIYYNGDLSELSPKRAPTTLPDEARFQVCKVTFSQEDSLPPWESYGVQRLGMNKEEMSIYQDILLPLDEYREEHPTHRILGNPDIIQNDMQLECQLVTNGLYCGDASGYQDPRAVSLESGAAEWQLLLQVDTEDDIDITWDDSGRLYYWIPRAALRSRDFEQVWVILQSY